MPDIKCPHCGRLIPADSKFCNHCGTPISSPTGQIECPNCHQLIPADSTFCPNCRQRVRQPGPNAWQQQGMLYDQADDTEADEQVNPHRKRNIAIIAAIAAFLALVIVKYAFFNNNDERNILDSASVTTSDESDKTLDIFNRTLDANGLKNDGDKIAYAMRVLNEQGQPGDEIVGVTYRSDDEMSFYRIYTLQKNGSQWSIKRNVEKYLNGRKLVFDAAELGSSEIPLFDNIGGKQYFYFAYANMPRNASDTVGYVVTSYFDVAQGTVTATVTYSGEIVRASGGSTQVIGRNTRGDTGGILGPKLQEHAQHIGYLHIPTPEEIAAEQEEKRRLEEERLKAEQAEAEPTSDVIDEATFETGGEVKVSTQEYDKSTPLFRADEFKKKINAPGYTVFLLKNGRVYAFNKSTNKNFEVHFGRGTATDIGWEDSGTGVVNVRTDQGKVQCNLSSHTIKRIE